MAFPAIKIEDLTKHYKKGVKKRILALEGLNLEIHQGEIFGFVGPNGAGKSTTIKLIMNLIFPTRGRVEILGEAASHPRARRGVGYLPENPSFYDHLTGEEFLLFAGSLVGLKGRSLKERAQELLELVGLDQAKKMTIRKYSKGMMQRLGIAQALVGDPRVVVMDEPMSGLDPLGRAQMVDVILSLKARGKTVFFSSHILHDVETICDRVGILVKGRLAYLGSPSRLSENPWWIIKLEGHHGGTLQEAGFFRVTSMGHLTQVEVPPGDLWEALEKIRTLSIPLYAVERKRMGLEEIFVKEVKGEA
jgi:ABC-2 type transport system ATP-binding protein